MEMMTIKYRNKTAVSIASRASISRSFSHGLTRSHTDKNPCLKLARIPTCSPLAFAALPSMSLIPIASFICVNLWRYMKFTKIRAPEFDLEKKLGSGQVFHWEKSGGGFVGTIGDRAVC